MIYFKPIFLLFGLISISLCSPRPNNETLVADFSLILLKALSDLPEYRSSTDDTSEMPSNIIAVKDKVQMSVFYETFCPFSVAFFVEQLKPAVLKLGSYLDLQLVPYGNAETSNEVDKYGRHSFSCQHGPRECRGNMVHACVIEVLGNNTKAALYNTCLMLSGFNYTGLMELMLCSLPDEYITAQHIVDISICTTDIRGSNLLKSYGELTAANKIEGVPQLLFSGSSEHEDDARNDLVATICNMLNPKPQACTE